MARIGARRAAGVSIGLICALLAISAFLYSPWHQHNRLARQIQVRKEKIRVLLAQSYPSYEFRYLRNLLRR